MISVFAKEFVLDNYGAKYRTMVNNVKDRFPIGTEIGLHSEAGVRPIPGKVVDLKIGELKEHPLFRLTDRNETLVFVETEAQEGQFFGDNLYFYYCVSPLAETEGRGEFSIAELRLLTHYKIPKAMLFNNNSSPMQTIRMAALNAFEMNIHDEWEDVMREYWSGLNNSKFYRMSKEAIEILAKLPKAESNA